MKFIFSLVFFCILGTAFADKIPGETLAVLEAKNIHPRAMILVLDPNDCRSCSDLILDEFAGVYRRFPELAYVLTSQPVQQNDVQFLLSQRGVTIQVDHFLTNAQAYDFFCKSTRLHTFIISRNSAEYEITDGNGMINHAQAFDHLSAFESYNFHVTDSTEIEVPYRFSTSRNLVKADNESVVILNLDDHQVIYRLNETAVRAFNFDTLFTSPMLFSAMRLSSVDSALTTREFSTEGNLSLRRSVIPYNINRYGDSFYITAQLSYLHYLDSAEVSKGNEAADKSFKLKKGTIVTQSKTVVLIVNAKSLYSEILVVKELADKQYSLNLLSGVLFDDNRYYFNLAFIPSHKMSDQEFLRSTQVFASFVRTTDNHLVADRFSDVRYPEWYGQKLVRHNFANGDFSKDSQTCTFKCLSHPFVVDVKTPQRYSISARSYATEIGKKDARVLTKLSYRTDDGYNLLLYNLATKLPWMFEFGQDGTFKRKVAVTSGIIFSKVFQSADGMFTNVRYNNQTNKLVIHHLQLTKVIR